MIDSNTKRDIDYEKNLDSLRGEDIRLYFSEFVPIEFLARMGKIRKIPVAQGKTPDFEIIGKDITIEIKSINTILGEVTARSIQINAKDEEKLIARINSCINKMEKKQRAIPGNHLYLGVIYTDMMQVLGFKKPIDFDLIQSTKFNESRLDALLIYQDLWVGKPEGKIPLLFSKSLRLTKLFEEAYSESELKIIPLY